VGAELLARGAGQYWRTGDEPPTTRKG
jgi:hypothetical protein